MATDLQSLRDLVILTGVSTCVMLAVAWLLRNVLKAIFVDPVKTFYENRRLRKLLLDRCYHLTYNPKSGKWKAIGFAADGQITDGQNVNEHTWRVRGQRLEIFGSDGRFYSRFRYDTESGRFVNTNDPDKRSISDQYIEPVWERAAVEQPAAADGEDATAEP